MPNQVILHIFIGGKMRVRMPCRWGLVKDMQIKSDPTLPNKKEKG